MTKFLSIMDRISTTAGNAFLLAALPLAAVTIVVRSL